MPQPGQFRRPVDFDVGLLRKTDMRFDCLLGTYPDGTDEFQIGSRLIFVSYAPEKNRRQQLSDAERRLATLEQDIPKVVALVTSHVGSAVESEVIGIRIYPDGTASYDCTFFDGEYADKFFHVARSEVGELQIENSVA
jgi:hypothetical protein